MFVFCPSVCSQCSDSIPFSACVMHPKVFVKTLHHVVLFLLIQAEPIALFRRWMDDINHSMAFSQLVCSIVGKGGLRSTRSAGNAGFKRSWCLPWDRHMAHMAFVNTRVAVNMMNHYETYWIRLFVLPLPTTWNCKCVELGVLLTVLSSKVFLQSTSVRRCGTLIVPCVSWVLATSI